MASSFVYVLIMVAVVAFMIMRNKSMKAQIATDYAHSQASAVAHRLGFTLVRGEPTTNLQMADMDSSEIQKVDVLLTGRPHGIPTKIIYYRGVNAVEVSGQRDLQTTYECRIVAETRANCGRFEIRLKNPHDVVRAKSYFEKEQPLPPRTFGDPTLDSVLYIEADDPALSAKIAPQLGGLVGMSYVHVVGESGSISYDMAHAEHGQHLGCAYGFHYIEQLPTLLASIVCVLEGMAAPSAMPAA
jgi:hypothetical protein